MMRKFIQLTLFFLVAGLFTVNQVNAQAQVYHEGEFYITDPATGIPYPATKVVEVRTPNGNVLVQLTFQVPPESLPSINGVWVIPILYFVSDGQDVLVFLDLKAHLFPSGKIMLDLHLNGSGNITPGKGTFSL